MGMCPLAPLLPGKGDAGACMGGIMCETKKKIEGKNFKKKETILSKKKRKKGEKEKRNLFLSPKLKILCYRSFSSNLKHCL